MGGLLHLVQRGGDWAGPQPAQALPRCTKCNSPPINGQCTKLVLFDEALKLPSESKGLIITIEISDMPPSCYHQPYLPTYTVSRKKVPLIFLLQLLQILIDFHNFSCTTSQENAKVIDVKSSCHAFVMLLPYRVKISDTKVKHFTPILALCTCLYRSHLQKPVSTKQTEHSRKSEAQNLCSKCLPFT